MSWLGGSVGMMWSIVQSLPSKSLLQIEQIGSRIVLAYDLAFAHSLDWCHSAMLVDDSLSQGDDVLVWLIH
jgi:hypothetical protein